MDGVETVITRAFSGKPARAVRNRFVDRAAHAGRPFLPFPVQQKLTAPLRAAGAREGSAELHPPGGPGKPGPSGAGCPRGICVRTLMEEACDTIDRLRRCLSPPP